MPQPIPSGTAVRSAATSAASAAANSVADSLGIAIPSPLRSIVQGVRSGAVDKTAIRRTLLKRYVDLAFAKEDQIMASTQVGTAVTCGVADIFTFGLTTIITKNIEGPVMATIRGVRRVQASQMFSAINAITPARVQLLVTQCEQQGEPGFDWLRNQLSASSNAAAAASAGTTALASAAMAEATSQVSSAATTATTSAVTDAFCDYVADAVFDSVAASLPFGIGAIKSGGQVAQVSVRIVELRAKILALKNLAR